MCHNLTARRIPPGHLYWFISCVEFLPAAGYAGARQSNDISNVHQARLFYPTPDPRFSRKSALSGIQICPPPTKKCARYLVPREVGTKFLGMRFGKGRVNVHLKKLGIHDEEEQYANIEEMLDAFYRAITDAAVLKADPNSLMVDTRRVLLENDLPARKLWKDEIHPRKKGFRMVAKHIKAAAEEKDLWRL